MAETYRKDKRIERLEEFGERTNDAEQSGEVTVGKETNSIGEYIKGDRRTRFLILSFGMRGRERPSSA